MTARVTMPQQLTMDLAFEDSPTPARLSARTLAGLIDLAFVALAASAVNQPFPPILVVAIFILYHATQTWWTGRTIGKALLGLRIVRPGGRITIGWAIARAGPGYLILGLAGVGLATCAFDPQRRSLYDLALGGLIVQETDASFRPHGLLDRFTDYAKEHKHAAAERKETVALATGLWTWLSGLGDWILRLLNPIRGKREASTGPSVLTVVSGKVATVVAIGASVIATVVATAAPPARGVGEWLTTDRYWYGASHDRALALEGPEQAIARWMQRQGEPYVGTCPDPATVDDEASSWCTLRPLPVPLSEEPRLREAGVSEGLIYTLGGEGWWDTFWAQLLVIEQTDGWQVTAIRSLEGTMDGKEPGSWLSPDVGLDLRGSG